MLSIQIDTKSLELEVQQHQIVLLCKPYEIKFSIIDAVRLLDTLDNGFVLCSTSR